MANNTGSLESERTGDVIIDAITGGVLRKANCYVVSNTADINMYVWMEEELNHPLKDVNAHTPVYLTVRTDSSAMNCIILYCCFLV